MAEEDSLRERALYAWQHRVEIAKQEREARDAASLAILLYERLGVRAEPESSRVTIDGLTFTISTPRNPSNTREAGEEGLHLLWDCPKCDQPVPGSDITDLQELGRQLESGIPPHKHAQRQPKGGEEG